MQRLRTNGFTLIEIMLGASILAVVIVALMGAFISQAYLNTNARNLTAAMNNAMRVMEQIRLQNTLDRQPCKAAGVPTVVPVDSNGTALAATWNEWLQGLGGARASAFPSQIAISLSSSPSPAKMKMAAQSPETTVGMPVAARLRRSGQVSGPI